MLSVKVLSTIPIEGQKPGTSGLRKATKKFMEGNYTHNFVQSYLTYIANDIATVSTDPHRNSLIVGGDGRFFVQDAIKIIFGLCAANGVNRIIVGQNGLLSTPAVSHLIRKRQTLGGIILTASHNPGGLDADFGIKFNAANGGPAPEATTNTIFKLTCRIEEYKTVPDMEVDLKQLGEQYFSIETLHGATRRFAVEVIDPVNDYVELMKEIFDFPLIKTMLTGSDGRPPFKVLANAMHAVMGPYVMRVFGGEFGVPEKFTVNCIPKEDFGGGHPDPNLTYAKELVNALVRNEEIDMGFAFDGDGDRNMVLGKKAFFVSPCDSVAALANDLYRIPYFQKSGVKGLARSMPTSAALDRVAESKKLTCFETPTGWKFFGNLMDANQCSLCGEESFGTGSDHIREKDGMWAVLAWLQILAHYRKEEGQMVSIEEIMTRHWMKYGRNFFTRYDYENCSNEAGNNFMNNLEKFMTDPASVGRSFTSEGKTFTVKLTDNFSYEDPIDKSVTKKQGIRVIFTDGSRIIYRLSGTGSSGATIRLYIDSYYDDKNKVKEDSQIMLKPLINVALEISQLKEITGRQEPTVIT